MRLFAFLLVLGGAAAFLVQQSAGLPTVVDASGDTIVARVSGVVPAAAIRRLVTEMKIAPGIDDTTLFTNVSEFDVDRRGSIWVFDVPTRSILLFDSTGKLMRRIGRRGGGPGEFSDNGGMVILGDGRLAQWAPGNARISFFSPAGDYLTSWAISGGFGSNNNLVTDAAGRIYTRRPRFGRGAGPGRGSDVGVLVRFDNGGVFGDTLAPPTSDLPSYIISMTQGNARMNVAVPYTARSHWAWHPDGYFIAGNGANSHILIARKVGKPIRIERVAPSIPIPDPQWKALEERAGQAIPHTKAPLEDVFVSRDGRIWTLVATPSLASATRSRTAPRTAGLGFGSYRSATVWEVYSPTGTFLGRVQFPERAQLVQADGDLVWVIDRDEDDLPAVARMRISPSLGR